jgi:hypothetical protein
MPRRHKAKCTRSVRPWSSGKIRDGREVQLVRAVNLTTWIETMSEPIAIGRFHLGTETEAAKYRRRVASTSRELATLPARLAQLGAAGADYQ